MILNEQVLFNAVMKKFGIENENCGFSAQVLTLFCIESCGSFAKGDTYTLWFGSVSVGEKEECFACRIDGDVEKVSKSAFIEMREPVNFMHSDGYLHTVIRNSAGVRQIVPTWWLDLIKVKKYGRFAAKYAVITGKFEHVRTETEDFYAWVFSAEKELLKVFNVETGEWIEAGEITARLPMDKEQIVKIVGWCYEHDFIQHSRVVNIVH